MTRIPARLSKLGYTVKRLERRCWRVEGGRWVLPTRGGAMTWAFSEATRRMLGYCPTRDKALAWAFNDAARRGLILPIRDDVEFLTYHRNPTPAELHFGEGAIHYCDVPAHEACYPGTRVARPVVVIDDARWYR